MHFFQDDQSSDIRYSACRDKPQFSEIKNRIENLWDAYKPFCGDGPEKFINDAKSNFCGQVWHLYLANLFKNNGFKLLAGKPGQPDLCFEVNGSKLWIEAVSVSEGIGENKAPGHEHYSQINGFFQPSDSQIQLRLSSAFITKKNQVYKYIDSGLVAKNDLCLIAVNSGNVSMSDFTPDFSNMFKVLYAVKGEYWSNDRTTGHSQMMPIHGDSLTKASGETFQVAYFENSDFERINGVIFFAKEVFNLLENAADSIQLIPNLSNGDIIPDSIFKCFGDRYRVKNGGLVREKAS